MPIYQINTIIIKVLSDLELSEKEKEGLVIEMRKKKIPPREIAKELRMSLRDIYKIIRREFGDKEKELTTEHQALTLFLKGKRPVDVALKLRISLEDADRNYIRFKNSFYLGKFGQDYSSMKGHMKELAQLCSAMKNEGLNVKELIDGYYLARDLGDMEERQLEIMKGNDYLEKDKVALRADNIALITEKVNLEKQINDLKPEVYELESRLSLTKECLAYSPPNNGYNYNYYQTPNYMYNPNQQYLAYYQSYYRW